MSHPQPASERVMLTAMGCLTDLFGVGFLSNRSTRLAATDGIDSSGTNEGDVHPEPGGYEGMVYSDGYAVVYFNHDYRKEGEENL